MWITVATQQSMVPQMYIGANFFLRIPTNHHIHLTVYALHSSTIQFDYAISSHCALKLHITSLYLIKYLKLKPQISCLGFIRSLFKNISIIPLSSHHISQPFFHKIPSTIAIQINFIKYQTFFSW